MMCSDVATLPMLALSVVQAYCFHVCIRLSDTFRRFTFHSVKSTPSVYALLQMQAS